MISRDYPGDESGGAGPWNVVLRCLCGAKKTVIPFSPG
jgi:hypothetical protein